MVEGFVMIFIKNHAKTGLVFFIVYYKNIAPMEHNG